MPVDSERFRASFVLVLVLAVSALFLAMIWGFLKALLLAAILSGLLNPVYRRLVKAFRGREVAASVATILLLFIVVVGPLTGFLSIVAAQAIDVSETAIPWVKNQFGKEDAPEIENWITQRFPFLADFMPSRAQLLQGVGELAQKAGNFLVAIASKMTTGTARFLLDLFVMLYAMFFFLIDGRRILEKIFYFMPLTHEDEVEMLDRFASITRATIKGTLIIAIIQGTLGGIGFAVAGIKGAAFWGTMMMVLSILPGIGTALVWVPAVIYLVVTKQWWTAGLLTAWSAGVVGTVDNLLRPKLVGQDAKLPDLLILVGTLGGIVLFGAIGLIVGPIVCGIFITVWDIYGVTFRKVLPPVMGFGHRDADHASVIPGSSSDQAGPKSASENKKAAHPPGSGEP